MHSFGAQIIAVLKNKKINRLKLKYCFCIALELLPIQAREDLLLQFTFCSTDIRQVQKKDGADLVAWATRLSMWLKETRTLGSLGTEMNCNIASRATQSNSVYVSVLKIPLVHADSVSKSIRQNFFARAAVVSGGENIIFRDNN